MTSENTDENTVYHHYEKAQTIRNDEIRTDLSLFHQHSHRQKHNLLLQRKNDELPKHEISTDLVKIPNLLFYIST
jgi:hypothetical protein